MKGKTTGRRAVPSSAGRRHVSRGTSRRARIGRRALPGMDRRAAQKRAHAHEESQAPAPTSSMQNLLHCEPEGRRRQDHDDREPGRRPGRLGQRVLVVDLDPQGNATMGSGHRQARARPQRLRRAARKRDDRRGAPDELHKAATTYVGANRELAGAEIELVDLERRDKRLSGALAAVACRLRLRADRLPARRSSLLTLNGLCSAHGVDRADAVRVLRARRLCATWSTRSSRCTRT